MTLLIIFILSPIALCTLNIALTGLAYYISLHFFLSFYKSSILCKYVLLFLPLLYSLFFFFCPLVYHLFIRCVFIKCIFDYYFFTFLLKFNFLEHFRFRAKLIRRYRDFLCTPWSHTLTVYIITNIPHQINTCFTNNELTLIHHNHL